MIFNFTDKYKFTKNLNLNDKNLEAVKQAKLLGVMISDDLNCDKITEYLVKKAFSRMELIRKVDEFTKSIKDKREIYILYIRSILEQSCMVWHSSKNKLHKPVTGEKCLALSKIFQEKSVLLFLKFSRRKVSCSF